MPPREKPEDDEPVVVRSRDTRAPSGSAPWSSALYAAFVLGAALLVYGFVTVAKEGELRRRCSAACLLHPQYIAANRKVPSFTLPNLAGRQVSIEDYRGKVVVLNFWTRTCGPCMEEMPEISELTHVLQSRPDVAVVTISTDEGPDAVKDILKSVTREEKPPFEVLFDPDGDNVVDKKFGTHLFPETWLIDQRGVIRARFDGSRSWSSPEVVELIDQLRAGGYCPMDLEGGDPMNATGEGARVCNALSGT